MTHVELQAKLKTLGCYKGALDGLFGPASQAALRAALTMGPDTALTQANVAAAALKLGCTTAHIWTVWDVEASGNPFTNGMPTILFEPHIFSRLTAHRYDRSHPRISSRSWNAKLYPGSQGGRWDQLCAAVALDPDAGLAAASYGAFQVLGSNARSLGYASAWDFAYHQSLTVADQLDAFVRFVLTNGLAGALRRGEWAKFARGYNGAAYAVNKYDTRLAARFAVRSQQARAA